MEIANQADRFLSIRRSRKSVCSPSFRMKELMAHLTSQGGQRALIRLELHADSEVERTYLLGDPLRAAFKADADSELRELNISSSVRSYADRLILEAARHHQAQSEPGHAVWLMTGDQGLARMALAEGVRPLYFTATNTADFFGRRLVGQTFHPFSGFIHRVPLTALLWELATAFGSVRMTADDGAALEVSAIGENLSWAPYHAEHDLLWCKQSLPHPTQQAELPDPAPIPNTPMPDPSAGRDQPSRPAATHRSTSFLRFNVGQMFKLICALDDQQELATPKVEETIGGNSNEYRRFLQSGHLIHVVDGTWKARDRIPFLSAALRNEQVEDLRRALLELPSFAAFSVRIAELAIGTALDTTDMVRSLTTYRTLGEITLLCASAFDSGIYPTPTVPSIEAFADIALRRFSSLDLEGRGLVATGEWLEPLIRDDGVHPETARRLLEEASVHGLLKRSTEGSTTQLRFEDRVVHVLRTDAGSPVVERVHLYRGDYLIPGKASASLHIEGPML